MNHLRPQLNTTTLLQHLFQPFDDQMIVEEVELDEYCKSQVQNNDVSRKYDHEHACIWTWLIPETSIVAGIEQPLFPDLKQIEQ